MKRLSDYQGEAAIDLWADIMDSASVIIQDEEFQKKARTAPKIVLAKEMLKSHSKEVCDILLRIDDTPINGINVLTRLVVILSEIGENPEMASFFGMQGQIEQNESSGSAMESTEEKEQ